MDETIHKAVEHSGWKEKWGKLPPFHGIGIGTNSVQTGFPMGIRGGSQAFIKFNEDGEATVMSGVVDNGQGNDNMLVQIAAEELGLLPEDIHLVSADTETTSSDPGSYSQVSTFVGGHAVKIAAQNCREKLFEVASKMLKVAPDKLAAKNRLIFVKDDPKISVSITKVVRVSLLNFNSVNAEGGYWPKVDMKREWVSNPLWPDVRSLFFRHHHCRSKGGPGYRAGGSTSSNRLPGCRQSVKSAGSGRPV